jgi:hypothetical protein
LRRGGGEGGRGERSEDVGVEEEEKRKRIIDGVHAVYSSTIICFKLYYFLFQDYKEEMDERESKDEKDEIEAVSVEGGSNTKNSKGKQKNNFTAKKPFLNIIQYLQQVRYKYKCCSFTILPFFYVAILPF